MEPKTLNKTIISDTKHQSKKYIFFKNNSKSSTNNEILKNIFPYLHIKVYLRSKEDLKVRVLGEAVDLLV